MTEDLVAAAGFLKSRPECTGKIGAVGFCYGGGIVNTLATRMPDLAAAVPFYGPQPSAADAAKIKSPMLLHYAALDEGIDRHEPRLPQRYDPALRRGRRQAGVVAHDCIFQGKPEGLSARVKRRAPTMRLNLFLRGPAEGAG